MRPRLELSRNRRGSSEQHSSVRSYPRRNMDLLPLTKATASTSPILVSIKSLSVFFLILCMSDSSEAGLVPGHSRASSTDLTDLCCISEVTARVSDHAILAQSSDRALARLFQTSSYNQMLVETYCMSLVDRNLHVTVHPRCVGHCRQVKEAQEAIVIDEHGDRRIREVVVNSGCIFVAMS